MLEPRTGVMILVEASWDDQHGASQTAPACMEDKSPGGACIRLKVRIAVGTRIKVQGRWQEFTGVTRYCRPDSKDFVVGIQRDTANAPAVDPTAVKEARRKGARKAEAPALATSQSAIPLARVAIPSTPEIPPSEIPHASKAASKREPAQKEEALQNEIRMKESSRGEPIQKESTRNQAVKLDAAVGGVVEAVRESIPIPPAATPPYTPLALESRLFTSLTPEIHTEVRTEQYIEHRSELRTETRTERRSEFRIDLRSVAVPEPPLKDEPVEKAIDKERKPKFMGRKWLEMAPWRAKPDTPSPASNPSAASPSNNQKESLMDQPAPSANPAAKVATDDLAAFQVELTSMEDIYRAAGIMPPRKGYSIQKVVEMLNSEHIRSLSRDMKRVAVLMALDAAGVPLDEVLSDAKARHQALEAHENEQRKRAEAEWTRKAEENTQIEAELERLKAHHLARIHRNNDAIAREKATFNSWLLTKQQESLSMTEAADLCLKAPAPAPDPPAADPAPPPAKALAKTV